MKLKIAEWLKDNGHQIVDLGTDGLEPADYPDYALAVANLVAVEQAERGILICGTGIGMSMAANKFKGIRAALCYKPEFAILTRKHNDANILCLGEINGDELNLDVLKVFVNTEFEGGRHQRRVDKIADCGC
ncbi:ribose 5-phosphate isomerase B [Dehalogenimonas sp. WBC-2]|nr:ribose 5-phosphate isomerase B [Dehalogenimonas sp. WBC-2]